MKNDIVLKGSCVFRLVFTMLFNTSVIINEPHIWSHWIFAREDFCWTIIPPKGSILSKMDKFWQPIQWIISSQLAVGKVLVILSPHKVD